MTRTSRRASSRSWPKDVIDLGTDRLGGDLIEHDRRQDLLQHQAPDAAGDHDEAGPPSGFPRAPGSSRETRCAGPGAARRASQARCAPSSTAWRGRSRTTRNFFRTQRSISKTMISPPTTPKAKPGPTAPSRPGPRPVTLQAVPEHRRRRGDDDAEEPGAGARASFRRGRSA